MNSQVTRTWVLMAIVAREELPETSRQLAAYQFLAAMAPRDAASAFDAIGKARHVSPTVRTGLAVAASGSDGGRAWFAAVAVQEGLLPPLGDSEASRMEFEARAPALGRSYSSGPHPEEVRSPHRASALVVHRDRTEDSRESPLLVLGRPEFS